MTMSQNFHCHMTVNIIEQSCYLLKYNLNFFLKAPSYPLSKFKRTTLNFDKTFPVFLGFYDIALPVQLASSNSRRTPRPIFYDSSYEYEEGSGEE